MHKIQLEQIRGEFAGVTLDIPKGTTVIGRSGSDFIINDSKVSSMHAEIHYSGTRVYIYDKNSTNGTYVNGKKVTNRRALKDGDIISISGLGENAAAILRINIVKPPIRERLVFIRQSSDLFSKRTSIIAVVFIVLFFVWLMFPFNKQQQSAEEQVSTERPWLKYDEIQELPEEARGNSTTVTLMLNDTVLLSDSFGWETDIKYESLEDENSSIFESRLYVADLLGKDSSSKEVIKGIVTVQRLDSDFVGDIEKEFLNNFIWHEQVFLKENNIPEKFKYAKTAVGTWQWVIWNKSGFWNIYANVMTLRGRIISQASSLEEVVSLETFFKYFAGNYKEGLNDNF